MEQLTLEQAATEYAQPTKSARDAFKAGARWQKDQYKELIPLLDKLADLCHNVNEKFLSAQIESILKRLQD